jgi:hypothetical protein
MRCLPTHLLFVLLILTLSTTNSLLADSVRKKPCPPSLFSHLRPSSVKDSFALAKLGLSSILGTIAFSVGSSYYEAASREMEKRETIVVIDNISPHREVPSFEDTVLHFINSPAFAESSKESQKKNIREFALKAIEKDNATLLHSLILTGLLDLHLNDEELLKLGLQYKNTEIVQLLEFYGTDY